MGFKNVKKNNYSGRAGRTKREIEIEVSKKENQKARVLVNKSDPEYIARVKEERLRREALGVKRRVSKGSSTPGQKTRGRLVDVPINKPKKVKTTKLIKEELDTTPKNATAITTPFDDFLRLNPINKQLAQDPFGRITITKSQAKALADMSDEQFASYLSAYKSSTGIYSGGLPASGKLFEPLGVQSEGNIQILIKSRQRAIEARNVSFTAQRMALPNFGMSKTPYGPHKPYTVKDMIERREKVWSEQMFNKHMSPNIGPPTPFTVEAAEEELAFFRSKVGFEKGAKSIYQARVSRQIEDLYRELNFLDTLPNAAKPVYNARGQAVDAWSLRVQQIQERLNYLNGQLNSRNTMKKINPQYAEHLMALRETESAAKTASKVASRKGVGIIDPSYYAKFEQNAQARVSQTIAQETAEGAGGRMTSRIAETIGQDTMRAASVIHSSKFGYAAIGAATIAGVFGIGARARAKRDFQRQG